MDELKSQKNILMICFTEIEQIKKGLQRVRSQYPDSEINLLIPEAAESTFISKPEFSNVLIYHRAGGSLCREAYGVIREIIKKGLTLPFW